MDKETIIELIESHMLHLDRDRWDELGWMRFVTPTSTSGKVFIFFKDYLKDMERRDRNDINQRCSQFWREIGEVEKQIELQKVLGLYNEPE